MHLDWSWHFGSKVMYLQGETELDTHAGMLWIWKQRGTSEMEQFRMQRSSKPHRCSGTRWCCLRGSHFSCSMYKFPNRGLGSPPLVFYAVWSFFLCNTLWPRCIKMKRTKDGADAWKKTSSHQKEKNKRFYFFIVIFTFHMLFECYWSSGQGIEHLKKIFYHKL